MRSESTEPGRNGALDGMRALAVILVFGFHLRVPGFAAGYLGVDVFFVLSGFLITSLLLAEMAKHGRISLLTFWARRARRLLPALVVLLLVVAFATHLTATFTQRSSLRGDLLATTGYVANWRFIETSSYFANTGVDSPLQHTWSLAIEEQFYLLWPVLLAGLFLVLRRARVAVFILAGIGVVASVTMLAILYRPDAVERAYMGTDARIFEPMVGALGAALIVSPRVRSWVARFAIPLLALGVFGVVAGMVLIRPSTAVYYRGGAFLFSVATLLILMSLWVREGGGASRAFGLKPLAWLGVISYGVYLWHWPLILWLHQSDAVGAQAVIRGVEVVVLTVALAAASYYVIERPIRRGRQVTAAPVSVERRRHPGLVLAAVPVVLLLVAAASVEATTVPPPAPGVPVVMLVGDSVPLHLGAALEEAFGKRGWRMATAARGSCAVTGEVRALWNGQSYDFSHWCRDVTDNQDRMIQKYDPDIVLWWDRWSLSDFLNAQGQVLHSGTPAFWQARRTALDAAVARLGAQGARVVFVATEPPGQGVWSQVQICGDAFCGRWRQFLIDHYADITTKWNRTMQNYARHHPQLASYISITSVVCKTDVAPCNDTIDGAPARPDGTHYVGAGSDEAVAALIRRLVPIVAAQMAANPG